MKQSYKAHQPHGATGNRTSISGAFTDFVTCLKSRIRANNLANLHEELGINASNTSNP